MHSVPGTYVCNGNTKLLLHLPVVQLFCIFCCAKTMVLMVLYQPATYVLARCTCRLPVVLLLVYRLQRGVKVALLLNNE